MTSRVDYLPHLLLGRVLLVQMDCTGALDAWEESDRQGVARKVKDGEHVREIDSGYATCEAKGFLPSPKFRKELDEARGVVRGAADEGRRLAEHVSTYDDSIKAAHRKQVTLAESRMQTANDKMAAGERTRRAQDLADARAAAGLALTEYRASRAPLDALIQAVGSFQAKIKGAESELAAVDGRGRELDTLLSEAPVKVAPNDGAVAARGKADALRGLGAREDPDGQSHAGRGDACRGRAADRRRRQGLPAAALRHRGSHPRGRRSRTSARADADAEHARGPRGAGP